MPVTTGDLISAADWNVLEASGGTWSPTYGNLTVGNGTVVARFAQTGDLVHCWYKLVFGSTTAITGAPTISAPIQPLGIYDDGWATTALPQVGHAVFADATGSSFSGLLVVSDVNFVPWVITVNATFPAFSNTVTATSPFTWATSDVLYFSATYEAA